MSVWEEATRIAEAAQTAWMAEEYGPVAFARVASFLLAKGHSPEECEAILRSKHMRWADDSQGRGIGADTTSSAFIRYYENARNLPLGSDWLSEGRMLAAETPLVLRGEES